MDSRRIIKVLHLLFAISNGFVVSDDKVKINEVSDTNEDVIDSRDNTTDVFNGVYSECFLYLSYTCLQRKTWKYLKELDKLDEVSLIGGYVKFVKLNKTIQGDEEIPADNTEDLSLMIDDAVNSFFNNHVLKFNALGKDIVVPHAVEEFVGRKRKGGGGGGGGGHGGGGHGGGDDGGKKKMMMMAMMCMKMKLMMMVPAMMGMMGMMSFKGMMFSMMSFMISKMMLLMKILEKKGGGGGGGGGGDGGWAAGGGGGGGGAWMPAGGQDYGGGGGGYDANGQWQSRSIIEAVPENIHLNKQPTISSVPSKVRYNHLNDKKPIVEVKLSAAKKLSDDAINNEEQHKSRRKRSIVDVLQNAYLYWINRMLGINNRIYPKYPKFKVIQGIKYVYYPLRNIPKLKQPKEIYPTKLMESGFQPMSQDVQTVPDNVQTESSGGFDPIVATEDFNKGEIMEIENRSLKRKLRKFKKTVNDAIDANPWE